MDRLSRGIVTCGLGLLVTASGCRSTRTEVPPGKPFANDGKPRAALGFSTEPHPVDGSSTSNIMPYNTNGSGIGAGVTKPNASAFGGPGGAFGPPGTSGMAPPATGNDDPAASPPAGAPPFPDMSPAIPRAEEQAPPPITPPLGGKPDLGSPDPIPGPN